MQQHHKNPFIMITRTRNAKNAHPNRVCSQKVHISSCTSIVVHSIFGVLRKDGIIPTYISSLKRQKLSRQHKFFAENPNWDARFAIAVSDTFKNSKQCTWRAIMPTPVISANAGMTGVLLVGKYPNPSELQVPCEPRPYGC